jgi:hypothetical protein
VVHKNSHQKNDRQRNPEHPKQCASSETHVYLPWLQQHQQNDETDWHSQQPQDNRHYFFSSGAF